jgi:hypothetical protein
MVVTSCKILRSLFLDQLGREVEGTLAEKDWRQYEPSGGFPAPIANFRRHSFLVVPDAGLFVVAAVFVAVAAVDVLGRELVRFVSWEAAASTSCGDAFTISAFALTIASIKSE